jgi:tRNA (guanine-N7-)-methyltransferase
MARKKTIRFDTLHDFPNAIDEAKAFQLVGKWKSDWFKNDFPIVMELGCGTGEFANGLADISANVNILAVDVKGDRLWTGARKAHEKGHGVRLTFLRARIDFLEKFFAAAEISEIWITFPDPQARKSTIRKRLTAPGFLARYKQILASDGTINLKTDTELLYQYTLEVLEETPHELLESHRDIYAAEIDKRIPILQIKTAYEKKHLTAGRLIKYIRFRLR